MIYTTGHLKSSDRVLFMRLGKLQHIAVITASFLSLTTTFFLSFFKEKTEKHFTVPDM